MQRKVLVLKHGTTNGRSRCVSNASENHESITDSSPPLQKLTEQITGPEDAMLVDLVPEIPPSGGYHYIMRAIDVFSTYLFAFPTSSQDGKKVARVNTKSKHWYLPPTTISDEGSVFLSQAIKEVAHVLGITLHYATTKHAQSIGLLKRTDASLKKALKIATGERRSRWHKYVSIAVLNKNTSYNTSIGCEPSKMFQEHVPYEVFDLKMGIRPHKLHIPNSQIVQDVPISREVTVKSDSTNSETCSTPGTTREGSPEYFRQPDG